MNTSDEERKTRFIQSGRNSSTPTGWLAAVVLIAHIVSHFRSHKRNKGNIGTSDEQWDQKLDEKMYSGSDEQLCTSTISCPSHSDVSLSSSHSSQSHEDWLCQTSEAYVICCLRQNVCVAPQRCVVERIAKCIYTRLYVDPSKVEGQAALVKALFRPARNDLYPGSTDCWGAADGVISMRLAIPAASLRDAL